VRIPATGTRLEAVKVLLRHPPREIEVTGPLTVDVLLARLDLNRESHLVVEDGQLVPGDKMLGENAVVEIRAVISGGSGRPARAGTVS
jgi:sulfur carrier protein